METHLFDTLHQAMISTYCSLYINLETLKYLNQALNYRIKILIWRKHENLTNSLNKLRSFCPPPPHFNLPPIPLAVLRKRNSLAS